jgi:hypothetical protein
MANSTQAQVQWVSRVLGVDVAGLGTQAKPALVQLWRDAKDEIDTRLAALATALHDFDDPDLDRIADFGLFGIGRGESVALAAALIEADRAAPAARDKLAKAVGQYRGLLSSRLVQYIDDNPLGVSVGMADRLGAALNEIESSIA